MTKAKGQWRGCALSVKLFSPWIVEMRFALDRGDEILTKRSADKINKDFEMHCKGQHPGSQIIGSDIPREDFSQAGARIVKEATGD
jgi:hypothetical protein